MALSFRHLPVEDTGVTADLEQLQQLFVKLAAIPNPAETTAGNTRAISEILSVLRAG